MRDQTPREFIRTGRVNSERDEIRIRLICRPIYNVISIWQLKMSTTTL